MPYAPLYTTPEAIALRLRGRLLVASSNSLFSPTVADVDLILQVLEQVEARINARLIGRYVLPLRKVHPVLASITEKLAICDLMATHFVSDGNNEPGGFGRLMCSQGGAELEDLLSGNTALLGELAIGGGSSTGTIANYSQVAQRRPGIAEAVDWGGGPLRQPQPVRPYRPIVQQSIVGQVANIRQTETDKNVEAGAPLYLKPTGHADLALANSLGTSQVCGLAISGAIATHSVFFQTGGTLELFDWTAATDGITLIPGARYFLDPIKAGKLTTVAPVEPGQIVAEVGLALSPTTITIEVQTIFLL